MLPTSISRGYTKKREKCVHKNFSSVYYRITYIYICVCMYLYICIYSSPESSSHQREGNFGATQKQPFSVSNLTFYNLLRERERERGCVCIYIYIYIAVTECVRDTYCYIPHFTLFFII